MRWIRRDPDLGYRDHWLWLPRSKFNEELIQSSMTVPIGSKKVRLWRLAPRHIGVPRARYKDGELDLEIVDLVPRSYPKMKFESNVTLDARNPTRTTQRDAFPALIDADGGVLNLSCGKGKTVLFLHAVAQWGEPALIINDQGAILNQWMGEIKRFLRFNGEIGMIQGNPKKWNWRQPIVLASLKTLAMYHEQIPPEMSHYFGRILWDEVHHLAAHDFSKTAHVFLGKRYGTTATVNRLDAGEMVYLSHLGPVFYSDLGQDVIPKVLFVEDSYTINFDHDDCGEVFDSAGELHLGRLDAYLGRQPEEIKLCQTVIDAGINAGKDMLVVAHSKERVRLMHSLYPGSGVMDSDVPKQKRLAMVREHRLSFGTVRMVTEALDKVSLDTLIILSEFSSPNILQQAMGRIQREVKGKVAKVVVIHHVNIPMLRPMAKKLMKTLRSWGIAYEVR